MHKRKWFAVIVSGILVLAIAAASVGCAGKQAPTQPTTKKGGTLVVAYWDDPISFNPDAKVDDAGYGIYQNIFNKLVTLDADYNIIPDLAEKWEISPDGKTYTFHLAKNVKWHDGQPFTAEDAKWTLETIIEKKGQAFANLQVIDKVEAPDPATLVVTLKQPNAPFLSFLAWYGTFIMPKHIYAGTDWLNNPANQKPVGTGPFRFVEWQKGDHITLEANPDYFKGAPLLDKVIYRIIPDASTALQAFLNGEVDVDQTRPSLSEVPNLQKTPGVKVMVLPAPSRHYVTFNFTKDPTRKLELRKAVALAINRQEIVEKALKGFGAPAKGFYTPAIAWAYNDKATLPDYNPEEAKKILDQAGFKPDKDGVRLRLTLPYFTGAEWKDIATIIKANLKEVGIDVKLEELEISAWMKKVIDNKDFDLTLLDGFQGPDPDNLRLRVGTKGSIQFMGYSNPEIDRLLEEAAGKTTTAERAPLYFKVQELMAQDLPIVPLSEVVTLWLFRDYVHGLSVLEGKGKVTFNDYSLVWLDKK